MPVPPLLERLRARVRRRWFRTTLRHVDEAGARTRFDLAYWLGDPWEMQGEREQHRFRECDRVIREQVIAPAHRVGSILEIGCGEGHQGVYLARLCDRLTGIDVSATAVRRARRRLPGAELRAGDLFDQPWAGERDRFDVVTAFEVLYLVKDVPRYLDTMSRLGRSCVISCFAPDGGPVERHLHRVPVSGRATVRHDATEWWIAWWRSEAAGDRAA
jgi:SAM-dependent methyltransferase